MTARRLATLVTFSLATVALTGLDAAAASPLEVCPPLALADVCLQAGAAIFVIVPPEPGTQNAVGQLEEWELILPTGGSASVTCFNPGTVSPSPCEPLGALGFTFVAVVATVSVRELDPSPLFCGLGVFSATLTVKALGTGVENLPVVTGGSTC